jgi:hypothetical protein
MRDRRRLFWSAVKLFILLSAGLGIYLLYEHPSAKVGTFLLWGGLLVVGAIPLLFLVVIILSRFFPGKPDNREAELARLAAELGLSFSAGETDGISGRFKSLPIFNQGNLRRATCVMEGVHRGRRLVACDYAFGEVWRDSHGNRTEYAEVVSAVVVSLDCRLPRLLIRPEDLLDKAFTAAGCEDINFESHEFSRRFHVAGDDRRSAYQVLSAQVMEHLLAHPRWSIELAGRDVMAWRSGGQEAGKFREGIEVLHGFLDLIPRFVWKELGEQREAGRQGAGEQQ